jgi:hypothetical protein
LVSWRKIERRGSQVGQIVQLSQKTGGGLNRILSGRIASGKNGLAQVSHTLKTLCHASGKKLATPDRSVIAVSSAIAADAENAPIPLTAFGQNRGNMRAVVLHGNDFASRQLSGVCAGSVLRMRIAHEENIPPIGFVHRDKIVDGLLKRAK